MKKYFTVKEASTLLGVSTNTVYKYLSEGKLIAKRFGRGRFKILYSSLAPYADTSTVVKDASVLVPEQQVTPSIRKQEIISVPLTQTIQQPETVQQRNVSVDIQPNESEVISYNVNDFVFVRIFKVAYLLGLGFVYLFTNTRQFSSIGIMNNALGETLLIILPYFLVFAGVLALLSAFWNIKSKTLEFIIQLTAIFATGYLSFLAVFSQDFGLFVFTGSLLFAIVGHVIRGIGSHDDFIIGYTKYLLFLTLIGGIVIFRFPEFVPYTSFAVIIKKYMGFGLVFWFGVMIPYLIFILTRMGRNLKSNVIFFFFTAFITTLISTRLTVNSVWDLAYLSYLTGIFAAFLGIWRLTNFRIERRNIYIVVISSVWITASILFGLFSINNSQKHLRIDALDKVHSEIDIASSWLNEYFDMQKSVMTTISGNQDMVAIIKAGDSERGITKSKEIYDKLQNVSRVLIYTKEGIAIGVYPRNTLAQGANYSSREYFQNTLSTYRGYLSPVFQSVIGTQAVMQTEPIFENNDIVGMIGVATSLEDIGKSFSAQFSGVTNIDIFDEKGSMVFASHYDSHPNLNREELNILFNENNTEFFRVKQEVNNPRWTAYLETPVAPILRDMSDVNTTISLLLLVNALFTIGIALVLSSFNRGVLSKPKIDIPLRTQGIQTSVV